MSERAQISEREGGVDAHVQRQSDGPSAAPTSARDHVLGLQRSAGNAAVVARLRDQSAAPQRAPSAPIESVPVAPGAVQREGILTKAGKWLKKAGKFVWNLIKPKTGGPIGSATTPGETESPNMTSKAQEEDTGGTSSSTEAPTESTDGGTAGAGEEGGTTESESTESESTESTDGGATEAESGAGAGSESGGTSGTGGTGGTETTEKTTEAAAGPIAPETKKTEPEHPSPPPLAMDLASGETVLKNAFGSMKTIVPGKIEILAPEAFKEAYDKIYGKGPYSWDKYVKPTYGSLNGFAHDGVNYINTGSAGLHTVVHEMLHNNTASDWRGVVGDRWDEGTTEILTQVACAKLSVDAPVCYPGESPCVQAALDAGLPLADLEAAYLNGGAKEKVADWVDKNCKENWAAVKGYMQAKNWTAAKAALAKKTA